MTQQPKTGPEWEENGRASDVPAKKIDLSKSLFPPEPDDYYAEHGDRAITDTRIDFAEVKTATLRSLGFIIPRLLPGGKRVGDEWVVRNPTRNDSKPGSFSVNMKTGVWADFATGDSGGDMIDLYVYLNGGSNIQAKNALAAMLNVKARGDKPSTSVASTTKPVATTALSEFRVAPPAFPPRTMPDDKGKPFFALAGEEGPSAHKDELRRHVYRQGGVPVRVKIVKKDKKGALNAYRVTGADGVTGWQYAMPEGYQRIPYFVAGADPFTAVINQPIFWTEGEKDVETVARLGGLAFSFGGCGDGLPHGCEQYIVGRAVVILADNDNEGREHAEKKAVLASKGAASVKVIHFHGLADKGDVSDWVETGKTFEDLKALVDATENWRPAQDTPDPNEIEIFWHGMSYNREARPWLVKELIPQTGQGLASGQWGAGKTFAVIDLSASVMTGTPFAGREICRRGGVMFIAAEGASEIPIRIQGVVDHKLRPNSSLATEVDFNNLPFAWIEECPLSQAGHELRAVGGNCAGCCCADERALQRRCGSDHYRYFKRLSRFRGRQRCSRRSADNEPAEHSQSTHRCFCSRSRPLWEVGGGWHPW
jgi:AAA domain-containing protein